MPNSSANACTLPCVAIRSTAAFLNSALYRVRSLPIGSSHFEPTGVPDSLSLVLSQFWGSVQDRLVPIFLATLAIRQQSARVTLGRAAALLDTFGLRQGGSQ